MGSIPQTCKPGHKRPGHWTHKMLALLLVCVSPLLVTAEVEQPAEISDEELKSIFKASFPATECPTENTDRFNSFCHSIWTKILKYIVYTGPSIKKGKNKIEGHTMGDDICGLVKEKVKAPFVGRRSKKFPKGLQIGMYSNACGTDKWEDTKDRHPERICCAKGRHAECPP